MAKAKAPAKKAAPKKNVKKAAPKKNVKKAAPKKAVTAKRKPVVKAVVANKTEYSVPCGVAEAW